MKKVLASLPPTAEFIVVLVLAFGPFLAAEVVPLFHPRTGAVHTNLSLLILIGHEVLVAGLLSAFLWARGWKPADIGLAKNSPFVDAGMGLLLALSVFVTWFAVWATTVEVAPHLASRMAATSANVLGHHIPIPTRVGVAIVNGVFEEAFVTGYIVTALTRAKRSEWFAINTSTAVRLAYHLYQGPLGVLAIVPTGLIFAFWFTRTKRLWPLMFAHILMDLVSLLSA